MVTVLGRSVDAAALEEQIAFLSAYNLLTDAGMRADWGLTLPGQERKTDLTELLAMIEDGTAEDDMVIVVDGAPITMADFKTMVSIQRETERIRSTYFPEGGESLNGEQQSTLLSLYQQLSEEGIQLYNTRGADDLVFPSGKDHAQRISVPNSVSITNNGNAGITVNLAHAAKSAVTVNWSILAGNATGTIGDATSGSLTFAKGERTKTLTVASSSGERWNGNRVFAVRFQVADGALFENGLTAASTAVYVSNNSAYLMSTE